MTESEWGEGDNPYLMLEFLKGKASDRKLRLIAVACVVRAWHLLRDERLRDALDMSEQFADGWASGDDLSQARRSAQEASEAIPRTDNDSEYFVSPSEPADVLAASAVVRSCASAIGGELPGILIDTSCAVSQYPAGSGGYTSWAEEMSQVALIRDIAGNPFHPVGVDPRWLTSTVRDLAHAIYSDRTFDRLPILADALEDAGCDSADLLAHLRGEGPHVRGCWALDLVLGKG